MSSIPSRVHLERAIADALTEVRKRFPEGLEDRDVAEMAAGYVLELLLIHPRAPKRWSEPPLIRHVETIVEDL